MQAREIIQSNPMRRLILCAYARASTHAPKKSFAHHRPLHLGSAKKAFLRGHGSQPSILNAFPSIFESSLWELGRGGES